MKKILLLTWMLLTVVSLSACSDPNDEPIPEQEQPENSGNNEDADDDEPNEPSNPTPGGNGRYLVLFASRSGNTERMANEIHRQLDCDILEVEPQTPYDNDYNSMLSRAQEELAAIRQGNYPPIKTSVESFENYDMIFVGYPIWHGSMATPMQTFLYNHAEKLSGKQIALFASSGSSGISASVGEARALCSDAEFTETLHLTRNTLEQMESRIATWLEQLNVNNNNNNNNEGNMGTNTLKLTVGDKTFTATLAENSSTQALKERLAQGPLSIQMSDYGDMEKVGSLGFSLPRNDRQTTTAPGDLIIYQGNSLVIYYDTNSWNFTRIGKIDNADAAQLKSALGRGDVTVTLSSGR